MLYYFSVLILTYFVYEVKRNKKGATVAQSVEQLIRNQQVAGSNPASSSTKNAWFWLESGVFHIGVGHVSWANAEQKKAVKMV